MMALKRASEGRTTIIIAHRLSTVTDADKIYVLDDGRVRESGTHMSLVTNPKSLYYQLWQKQHEADQNLRSGPQNNSSSEQNLWCGKKIERNTSGLLCHVWTRPSVIRLNSVMSEVCFVCMSNPRLTDGYMNWQHPPSPLSGACDR